MIDQANANGTGLVRRLHEQRIGQVCGDEADRPDSPDSPTVPLDATNVNKCDHDNRDATAELAVVTNEGEAVLTRSTYEPRVAHKVKPLTQSQLNAIDLLILGHSDRSAAHHLGIHPVTIGRWRQNHPAFRAELARRRQEIWSSAGETFRAQLQAAVTELKKQLEDSNQDVRYRAARTMLALARWFAPADEPVDVEGVLTQEARRLNVEKYELHPAQSLVYEDDREEALRFLERRAGEELIVGGPETLPHANKSEKAGLLSSGI